MEELSNTIIEILKYDNILTDDIIKECNDKTLKLFNNNDFITLLKIYNTNPDAFEILYKYTQNANIVESVISNKTIHDLTQSELKYYNYLYEKINRLNIVSNKDLIIDCLIKNSGHLNLTLRDLLNKI